MIVGSLVHILLNLANDTEHIWPNVYLIFSVFVIVVGGVFFSSLLSFRSHFILTTNQTITIAKQRRLLEYIDMMKMTDQNNNIVVKQPTRSLGCGQFLYCYSKNSS